MKGGGRRKGVGCGVWPGPLFRTEILEVEDSGVSFRGVVKCPIPHASSLRHKDAHPDCRSHAPSD